MKKIIFYYPKISGGDDSKTLYRGLPLSVLSLAAQFDPGEYCIKIVDGRLDPLNKQELNHWLEGNITFAGISSMTSYQITDGLQFARYLRTINPDIPIVWGGWHPSLMPEQTIEHELVDIVVIGQAELTVLQLAGKLSQGESIDHVPNLVFKTKDKKIVYTRKEPLMDMSKLEPIENAYSYVNMELYMQNLWGNEKVIGYESSRGCPWNCRFCSISAVYQKRWNALPPMKVVNGVEHLYRNYHIDAVHFYDNNFFVQKQRALEFSRLIKARGIKIKWDGTAVVEQFINFSEDYINQLKSSGFFRIIIGVESGDEEVLNRIDKRHNNTQTLEMVNKCAQYGIRPSLSFMVGFPWNPEKDLEETIKLIEAIKGIAPETEILLFVFSPYLGTDLYRTAKEKGMRFPENLAGWTKYTYEKVNTPWISDKLLRKINRYISFFGTKDMSSGMKNFLHGVKEGGNVAD